MLKRVCLFVLAVLATVTHAVVLAWAQGPPSSTVAHEESSMVAGLMPSGIMLGQAGQWMLGYEFMFDHMDGNRDGTDRVSHGKILERFMAAPTSMRMQMHTAMLMYAPTKDLTLMGVLPYVVKSMDHVSAEGPRFTERTEGISDLEVHGLYSVYAVGELRHRFLLDAGISVPTGSIDEKDFGPDRSQGRARLEYPMQLGSGTVALLPGITYLGQAEPWGWGAQFIPRLQLGRNRHDYRLGNRYRLSVWGIRKLTDWMSLSARADGERWDNIHGADPALDRSDEPSKDPNLQGGQRLDLLAGISFHVPKGVLKGQQFFIEAGAPVYQSLDGPQLQRDWLARFTWQWNF